MAAPSTWTPSEMMTIVAARALKNSDVCFVGIGAPSAACNLARLTHAPGITLIYESGTIATKPNVLPLSIGGAQIDRFANLNTTVVGAYNKPKVRLPGGGGAPEIATSCHEVFITMAQSKRSFVTRLDFITSLGHGEGKGSRERLGVTTKGPTRLITDLCALEPDEETSEMTVVSIHPGVTREQIADATGWPIKVAAAVAETPAPSAEELSMLRDLHARTRAALQTKPA